MINLEGLTKVEVNESALEKESMRASDNAIGNLDNYDDCALTEEERIARENEFNYDDCALTEEERIVQDFEDDFEDCRRHGR